MLLEGWLSIVRGGLPVNHIRTEHNLVQLSFPPAAISVFTLLLSIAKSNAGAIWRYDKSV